MNNHDHARTWATSLRIEQRYGVTRYVIVFTDGRLAASLFGSVDTRAGSLSPSEIAWKAAAEWLSHVNAPSPRRGRRRQVTDFRDRKKRRGA